MHEHLHSFRQQQSKMPICRSVVVAFLLLFWWPFGTVVNTFSDVWHILLRWNQYVSEYEMSSLSKSSTGSETPFANTKLQKAHDSSDQQTSAATSPTPGKIARQCLLNDEAEAPCINCIHLAVAKHASSADMQRCPAHWKELQALIKSQLWMRLIGSQVSGEHL